MILGLYLLWPSIFEEQAVFLLSATLSFLIPLIVAMLKFGQYPSYHTVGAKTAAVLLAPAYYLLIVIGADIWFRLVVIAYLLVAIEEIVITSILDRPKTNIKSVLTLFSDKN
jgi:CDP-diacylglycerol--glycerol-3-phosphate 3-phosphatidyltransferase